jgi:hypothetical protein
MEVEDNSSIFKTDKQHNYGGRRVVLGRFLGGV